MNLKYTNKTAWKIIVCSSFLGCFLLAEGTIKPVRAEMTCGEAKARGKDDGAHHRMNTYSVLWPESLASCYDEGYTQGYNENPGYNVELCDYGLGGCGASKPAPRGSTEHSTGNRDRFEHCYDPNNSENIFGAISCILEQGQ